MDEQGDAGIPLSQYFARPGSFVRKDKTHLRARQAFMFAVYEVAPYVFEYLKDKVLPYYKAELSQTFFELSKARESNARSHQWEFWTPRFQDSDYTVFDTGFAGDPVAIFEECSHFEIEQSLEAGDLVCIEEKPIHTTFCEKSEDLYRVLKRTPTLLSRIESWMLLFGCRSEPEHSWLLSEAVSILKNGGEVPTFREVFPDVSFPPVGQPQLGNLEHGSDALLDAPQFEPPAFPSGPTVASYRDYLNELERTYQDFAAEAKEFMDRVHAPYTRKPSLWQHAVWLAFRQTKGYGPKLIAKGFNVEEKSVNGACQTLASTLGLELRPLEVGRKPKNFPHDAIIEEIGRYS